MRQCGQNTQRNNVQFLHGTGVAIALFCHVVKSIESTARCMWVVQVLLLTEIQQCNSLNIVMH